MKQVGTTCIIAILFLIVGFSNTEAQNKAEVSGRVVDSQAEESLPGVNILIKGTTTGTSTGSDGNYSITVPSTSDTLVFSFIGFETQEIPINGRSEIDVKLVSKTFTGEELVVVGQGEQRKSTSLVGSITSVETEELQSSTNNLTQTLAGQVPGMIAFQRSGEPGQDNSEFFIRGLGTFGSGKVNPLILIDGIESSSRDMARLQPNDIEDFTVLKDATAAAIYGARGANGVVVIQTKTGDPGEVRFHFEGQTRVSTNTENFNFADNISYMRLANEAAITRDPNAILPYSRPKIQGTMEGDNPYLYPSNNWLDQLIKDYTVNQSYNLSAQGGGERAQYYISGTYKVDSGNLKVDPINDFNSNIKLRNYSIRSNISLNLTESTRAFVRVYGQFDDYNGPVGGGSQVFNQAIFANPVEFPAVYPQSYKPFVQHPLFGGATPGNQASDILLNPYAEMVRGYQTWKRSNLQPQIEIRQELDGITEGLSFRAMGYLQRKSYFQVSRQYNPFYYDGTVVPGSQQDLSLRVLNDGSTGSIGATGTEFLNYSEGDKTVNSQVYLEANLVYSNTFQGKHDVNARILGYISNFQAGNSGSLQQSLPQRNLSLSGKLGYSYDSRYSAEFNFGYNGSERFAKNHRFGFFPSVGLAYVISNEDFFNPFNGAISNLKLRATYGFLGNDQIGSRADRFFYLSEVNLTNGTYGATFGEDFTFSRPGVSVSRYANSAITWERSRQIDLGFDLGLFRNSLTLKADVYRRYRTNILQTRSNLGPSLGLQANPQSNTGEALSEGIDISTRYNQEISNNWSTQFRANFTYARNEIKKFDEINYPDELSYLSREGRSFDQRYGYIAERLFTDQTEVENSPLQFGEYTGGDIKYYDVNRDGAITSSDRVPMGHPTTPEIIYGFGGTLRYKTFDISVFFQGAGRTSFFINPQKIAPFITSDIDDDGTPNVAQTGLLSVIANDYWSESRRDPYAFWPRLSDEIVDNNNQNSSWWLRNGSFLRFKEIEVGYSLPRKMTESIGIRDLRVFADALNLAVWSSFDLWDPEMGGNGLGYPIQSQYNLGVQIDF